MRNDCPLISNVNMEQCYIWKKKAFFSTSKCWIISHPLYIYYKYRQTISEAKWDMNGEWNAWWVGTRFLKRCGASDDVNNPFVPFCCYRPRRPMNLSAFIDSYGALERARTPSGPRVETWLAALEKLSTFRPVFMSEPSMARKRQVNPLHGKRFSVSWVGRDYAC